VADAERLLWRLFLELFDEYLSLFVVCGGLLRLVCDCLERFDRFDGADEVALFDDDAYRLWESV
jgi:hypothetical protein